MRSLIRKWPVALVAAACPGQAGFADLLAALRAPASTAQMDAIHAFAGQAGAGDSIPALLAAIRAEAPALDNNGCLAVEAILRAHAAAPCAIDVLLEVIARPIWTSRQKGAQALALALRSDVIAGREEKLARAVIPLLASQRSRVFEAGAQCLARIAGKDVGSDPVAARRWFVGRFGKGIDLLAGVHEVVLVVRPQPKGFDVHGEHAADLAALTAAVRRARDRAQARGLEVGAVLQVAGDRVSAMLARGALGELAPIVEAIVAGGLAEATVAPESDVFRPPFAEDEREDGALRARLQAALDARRGDRAPGAQAGVVRRDGRLLCLASGWADRDAKVPMPVDGRMLAGSTGKTFFAALALQMVREGKLDLDAKLATFLGRESWFARLPNAPSVTLRHLMQHRSGIMRYELSREFLRALQAQPDHLFTPEEEVAFVLDRTPRFRAGEGFEYADTNYVLLGMVLERVTGRPSYDEIRRRFLGPLGLHATVPSVGRRIPGLVQGYAGAGNPFGGRDAMLQDGALPFDPGFEGAGGGFASTAGDLARWAKALYEGDVLEGMLDQALAGKPAPLGRDARYGLGAMIDTTPLGRAVGHSGFFPGAMTVMRYFEDVQIAVAVMVNTSAEPRLSGELLDWATELARIAAE